MREVTYNEDTGPRLSRVILVWSGLGVLVLLLSVGSNLFRPVWRGLAVSAAIVRDSAKYERQLQENQALEAELKFLKSGEGKRWAAWRYLGMVPPGWHVGRTVEGEAVAREPLSRPQRIQAWLAAQKDQGAQRLREAGDVARAYCGRRALDLSPEMRNPASCAVSKREEGTQPAATAADGKASGANE